MKRERSAFPGRERRVWKIKPFERVKESKKLISRDDKETDGEESEGRILAIDLGEKRTGIAMSDPLRIIAGGLKTVETVNLLQEIKNLSNQFPIEEIVVGYPLQMDGSKGEKAEEAEEFAAYVENELEIPATLFDERLTTREAERTLHEMGKKPSQDKGKVDLISAILILQGYLDRMQPRDELTIE